MADDVYYSALHWAKKAEASAKEAAENAASPSKVIQLGFDGSMQDNQLVFKHAPGGTEIPYQLVDDVEYELDLAYNGDLDNLTTMVVKNGPDTIGFVSAQHRSSTEPARVADMDAVMRYDNTTGYRWLFKATYKVTPSGAKVFLLYPVVAAKDYSDKTNCITEIPQDIKLELVDGVLTLKAGSKVYVPNGKNADDSNKFDEVVITNDVVANNYTGYAFTAFACYVPELNQVFLDGIYTGSGNGFEYNPNENYLRLTGSYTNSTWVGKLASLPLGLIEMTADVGNTSIIQTFNGFGYIDSTVFALPGVKGLIPNGRNADGTLKNIEFTVANVMVRTETSGDRDNQDLAISIAGIGMNNYTYNHDENYLYTASLKYQDRFVIGKISTSSGKITSFTTKLPFRAVVANDIVDSADASNNSDTIATTAWVNNKHQVVTALPSSPTAGVFYFIKE